MAGYPSHNHVAGFIRSQEHQKLICLFNFSNQPVHLYAGIFREQGIHTPMFDHWSNEEVSPEANSGFLKMEPYAFLLCELRHY